MSFFINRANVSSGKFVALDNSIYLVIMKPKHKQELIHYVATKMCGYTKMTQQRFLNLSIYHKILHVFTMANAADTRRRPSGCIEVDGSNLLTNFLT